MQSDILKSMARNDPLSPEQKRILIALETDWRRMCGNDLSDVPARLNPGQMHEALPHTFLMTRTGRGTGRIRVAGQGLHDLLGMDPRGMSLTAFFAENARMKIAELMESCMSQSAVVSVPLIAHRSFRRTAPAEILMLPMRDTDGEMSRILGCIVAPPQWLGRAAKLDVNNTAPLRFDLQEGAFPDRRCAIRNLPAPIIRPGDRIAAALHGFGDADPDRNQIAPSPQAGPSKLRLVVNNS